MDATLRHHSIFDVMLTIVFTKALGPSSDPYVRSFKRFPSHWPYVDTALIATGEEDEEVIFLFRGELKDLQSDHPPPRSSPL